MRGTVKWFDSKKGYGFIRGDDGKDIFVHHSQLKMKGFRTLNEWDIVNFEVEIKEKSNKRQAINVQPVITLAMVTHELAKENLHLMRIRDAKGWHGWFVADQTDCAVIDREMSLIELADYAGLDVAAVVKEEKENK